MSTPIPDAEWGPDGLYRAAIEHAIECYAGPDDDTLPVCRAALRNVESLIAAYRESQAENERIAQVFSAEDKRLHIKIDGLYERAEKAEADLAQMTRYHTAAVEERDGLRRDLAAANATAEKAYQGRDRARADLAALRAGIEAMAGDLWRVTPCGCGHRADLHTDAGCIAGLTICGCKWTFTTVLQERLRALSTSTDRAEDRTFIGSQALMTALYDTYTEHIGIVESDGPDGPYMWCACGWRSDDMLSGPPGESYAVHLVNAQHAASVKALQPIVIRTDRADGEAL